MAWPTDITAADRGRTLEVVFDEVTFRFSLGE